MTYEIGSVTRAAGVAMLSLTLVYCGGSSPTSPSTSGTPSPSNTGSGTTTGGSGNAGGAASSSCRTGPATYRIVTTAASVTSTINGSCTFNQATVEGTCTNQYSDSTGQSFTSTSTTRNSSRGEVVDEVSVIPPLNLSSSTTTTLSNPGQAPITSTATRTFSGRRILTQTSSGTGVTTVTTYTAWDSSERPTAATIVTAGVSSQQTISYDNAARTQTMTQGGVTCTQAFDANGNPTVGTCPGSTATFTMLTTQQICR